MADLPIGRRPMPMPQPRPGVSTNPGEEMMYGAPPEDQFMGMAPPEGVMGAGGDQKQALIEMILRMMEQQAQRSR